MSDTSADPAGQGRPAPETEVDAGQGLGEASPRARTQFVLRRIENAPDRPLSLPKPESGRIVLDDLQLGSKALRERKERAGETPPWWDPAEGGAALAEANLAGASLHRADLSGALLRGADFSDAAMRSAVLADACVEAVDFSRADLIGADFTRARAGEAKFRDALLEDARFTRATLRFADLAGTLLDSADFEDADLWGVRLDGAEMPYAIFRGATLQEAKLTDSDLTGADLRNANLKRADLSRARLRGANLQGADLSGANLEGADLTDASLPRLNLSSCTLHNVRLSGAWLESTRFHIAQLGGALGEETAREYAAALHAYRNLEQNFRTLGNPEAASWSYLKARRMGKWHELASARRKAELHQWLSAVRHGVAFLNDAFVEWLCDYGESLTRVLRSYAVTVLVFSAVYAVAGGLIRTIQDATGAHDVPTRNLYDLLSFSFLTMASGSTNIGVRPSDQAVFFIASLQYVVGVILTGLFGYVLGNRIRR